MKRHDHPGPARKRRLLPRVALGGIAAAALATAVLVGTTASPPDARAALLQAAEETGAADSGRLLWTESFVSPPEHDIQGEDRIEMRFSGENVEMVASSRADARGKIHESENTFRLIDGQGYVRDHQGPDGGWKYFEGEMQVTGVLLVTQQAKNPALVELVRSGEDVTSEDGPDGAVVYRATTTIGAYFDAAPTAAGRATTGEAGRAAEQPLRLEVTVGADGLIRKIHARSEHTDRTVEYFDLGEPQEIERPANAEKYDSDAR